MRVRESEGEQVTPEEIYDKLLAGGIKDPVCLRLGDRYVIGQWEKTREEIGGYICHSRAKAILVLGEGDNWIYAYAQAQARLGSA